MIHKLKTIQPYFNDVLSGAKKFEIRKNDRGFKLGDALKLCEYDGERLTGRYVLAIVDYIVDNPNYCKEGYVVMSLYVLSTEVDYDDDYVCAIMKEAADVKN